MSPAAETKAALPDDVLQELRALREASKGLVGNTPRNDPKRQASEAFCALAAQAIKEHDISTNTLSLKLGLSRSGLRLRLARHGHLKKPASQKAYIGTGVGSNTGKGKLRLDGVTDTEK